MVVFLYMSAMWLTEPFTIKTKKYFKQLKASTPGLSYMAIIDVIDGKWSAECGCLRVLCTCVFL